MGHGTWLQLQGPAMGPHHGGRELQPLGDCLGELTRGALLPATPPRAPTIAARGPHHVRVSE